MTTPGYAAHEITGGILHAATIFSFANYQCDLGYLTSHRAPGLMTASGFAGLCHAPYFLRARDEPHERSRSKGEMADS